MFPKYFAFTFSNTMLFAKTQQHYWFPFQHLKKKSMDTFQIEQLALAAISLREKQTPLPLHSEYEIIKCENTSVRSFVLRSFVAYHLQGFVCFVLLLFVVWFGLVFKKRKKILLCSSR